MTPEPLSPPRQLTLSVGPGRLVVGADGGLIDLRHPDRPEAYLTRWAPRSATVAGQTAGWSPVSRRQDAGECEVSYRWQGDAPLRLVLRHAVDPVWSERWTLETEGDEPVDIAALVADLNPGPGVTAWGSAAGAEAFFALLPTGPGPVLGAQLQAGAAHRLGPGGLQTESVRLRPGSRWALGWLLGWYATPWALAQRLPTVLPPAPALSLGEVWDLPEDPDEVVLAPTEVVVRTGERGRELSARRPGRYVVELRSGRGTVRTEVAWAAPLFDVVATRSEGLLRQAPRTSASIARLPDAAAALVVQAALTAGTVDDLDAAEEAVERCAADMIDARSGLIPERLRTPLAQIFVAREVVRTGDVEPWLPLLAEPVPAELPGAGLAALHVRLAGAVVGWTPPVPAVAPGAPLERALLGNSSPAELVQRLQEFGVPLGAGLTGHGLAPLDPVEAAYRVAVLGLVPEALGRQVEPVWGCAALVLAERTRTALLAGIALPDAALAWLCVAEFR